MFSNKPFIVAEMSANHLGSLDRALRIVDAAADAGADAVKIQTFTPSQMVGNPDYIIPGGPWHGRRLLSLYEEAHTPREWHKPIFDRCKEQGIVGFSTPFHLDDVAFLETLDCPIYKISSFEINDHELIKACAKTGRTLIISAGMATAEEICKAVAATKRRWDEHIIVLKCTSAYPADASNANLATMTRIAGLSGLSDHTPGIGVAVAAAALGATVIEKHLTLCRANGGPDAEFSMEPDEFAQMVVECRRAAASIGKVTFGPSASEKSSLELRRSLWFAQALPEGTVIQRSHLKSARPALGLSPSRLTSILGKKVKQLLLAGDPVTDDVIS